MQEIVNLIDGDSIPYIVAWNQRDNINNVDLVLDNINSFVRTILVRTNSIYYNGFLGAGNCFRHEIATHAPYKGNRPSSPEWYTRWSGPMKTHLRDEWDFTVVHNIEADDAVSICSYEYENSIISGADKDLKQIPGNHFNIRTHTFSHVDEIDGLRFKYKQMLIGDDTDNIKGCKGVGPKTADKVLDRCSTKVEMIRAVRDLFVSKHGFYGIQLFLETHRLVSMLHKPQYNFNIPTPLPVKFL